MTCPKNLGLLSGTLEWGTDHQGPVDHCWDMVGDSALQHHTDILKKEASPKRSPRSQQYDRACDGKGSFLYQEAGSEGYPDMGHGCSQTT